MNHDKSVSLRWDSLKHNKNSKLAVVSLNRPEQANAFNGDMLDEITNCLQEVAQNPDCRVLLVKGEGKHFSGGADLRWMQDSINLGYEENFAEARKMSAMFEALYRLPIPSIAIVKGAAFGGAVGLIACCDFAICAEDAKLSLSEVKIGILPAVIMPYLGKKMTPGALKRLGLTAGIFNGPEARQYGLVDVVCKKDDLQQQTKDEVNKLLMGGPMAHKSFKNLFQILSESHFKQSDTTATSIAKARQGNEAQSGFEAFFKKTKADWVDELPEDWNLN
ncbi:MAG: enoyl-CoA hydratase/isomerase family protein [Oligoflexales bacterium]|nr:enoyl-CoA hydratase/isomerase family protein [Oligoflexales bacterium]